MNRNTLWYGIGLLLLMAAALFSARKEMLFERISLEQGLSQGTVNCILQDSKGFMWFGTEDGLNRYDGYEFKIFRPDPGNPSAISHSTVWTLFEDSGGVLWVGTWDGLNRYERETETFVHYKADPSRSDSLSDNNVQAICEDRWGYLWIGTENSGLNRFDRGTGTFTHYLAVPGKSGSLSHFSVRCLYADSAGALWIGTAFGLNKLDIQKETFTQYRSIPGDANSLSNNDVRSLFRDDSGMLWVGTAGGLNRMDPVKGTFTRYRHDPADPESLSNDFIWSVGEGEEGTFWIGTYGGGVNRFTPVDGEKPRFIRYRYEPLNPGSISNNVVQVTYRDRSGLLWLGTWGGGVNKYIRPKYKFPHIYRDSRRSTTLINNSIWAAHRDPSGALWIGTDEGLDRFDPETRRFTHYQKIPGDPHSLSNNVVRAIYSDSSGTLWVGTFDGGLNRFDSETKRFVHYRANYQKPGSLGSSRVFTIYEDRSKALWVGTEWGLNLFDRDAGRFIHYLNNPNEPASLSNNSIRSIFEDSSGTLWIGTDGGLNRFDRKRNGFTRYLADPGNPGGPSSSEIMGIYESPDRPGILWFGTYGGGLNRLNREDETIIHYTEKDGLCNNVVYDILEDADGDLWLSTNRGLSKFDPEAETFKNYDVDDGLQSNEFNMGAACKTLDGRLVFGGINGFNMFYPERITENTHVPPVVITDFQVFNRPVPIGRPFGRRVLLDRAIDESPGIVLSPGENVFSFKYAALDYLSPVSNEYAYMLEGYDGGWNYVGNERFITYSNLPKGEYTLRVKGSNNDGVWNEDGVSLRIEIVSFSLFGMKNIFLLFLIVVGVAAVVFFIFKFYTKNRRKDEEEAALSEPGEPAGEVSGEASGELVDEANLGVFFEAYNISQREQEIVHLLIQGKKSFEIADLLYISKHTVKNHVYSIYRKVGVKNRVELTNFIHDFPRGPGGQDPAKTVT